VTLALLALAPAACSSGGATSGGHDAGRESGADAVVEQPPADGADDVAEANVADAGNDTDDDGGSDADAGSVDADASASEGGVDAGSSDAEAGHVEAGADGSKDTAAGDAAEAGPPCPTCAFYVTFVPLSEGAQMFAPAIIRYQATYGVDLFNGSDQPVSLAGVKIRYWFSSDNAPYWVWECGNNCAGINGGIVTFPPHTDGTDSYAEMVFTSGHLDAFSDTGQITEALLVPQTSAFTPPALENDYSFYMPTQPNPHMTIYVNDKVVWGQEPPP
jgi:hypothetical protein